MRTVRNKAYGQSPVGMIKTITPLLSHLGRIGKIHTPPTKSVEDDQKIPDFIANIIWEDREIVYPASEDPVPALPTPPKKTKKVWRNKNKTSSTTTTSLGTDETTST